MAEVIQAALRRSASFTSRATTRRPACRSLVTTAPRLPTSRPSSAVAVAVAVPAVPSADPPAWDGPVEVVGGAPVAARNSSDSVGASTPKSRTADRARTRSSTASGVGAGIEAQPAAGRVTALDGGGRPLQPAVLHGDVDTQVAVGAGRLQLRHVAVSTTRPWCSRVIDSHMSSTRSSWWLDSTTLRSPHLLRHDVGEELHGGGVEAGERLVEHEQVGLVHHGGGQLHPLAHAPREVLDRAAGPVGQAEALQQLGAAPPGDVASGRRGAGPARRGGPPRACPGRGPAPGACSPTSGGRAVVAGRPRHSTDPDVGLEHPEDDPHERRLAGAVGARAGR